MPPANIDSPSRDSIHDAPVGHLMSRDNSSPVGEGFLNVAFFAIYVAISAIDKTALLGYHSIVTGNSGKRGRVKVKKIYTRCDGGADGGKTATAVADHAQRKVQSARSASDSNRFRPNQVRS